MKKEIKEISLCPFIQNPPSNYCYCVKLLSDSLSIDPAIYYCGENYLKCRFYKYAIVEMARIIS